MKERQARKEQGRSGALARKAHGHAGGIGVAAGGIGHEREAVGLVAAVGQVGIPDLVAAADVAVGPGRVAPQRIAVGIALRRAAQLAPEEPGEEAPPPEPEGERCGQVEQPQQRIAPQARIADIVQALAADEVVGPVVDHLGIDTPAQQPALQAHGLQHGSVVVRTMAGDDRYLHCAATVVWSNSSKAELRDLYSGIVCLSRRTVAATSTRRASRSSSSTAARASK